MPWSQLLCRVSASTPEDPPEKKQSSSGSRPGYFSCPAPSCCAHCRKEAFADSGPFSRT